MSERVVLLSQDSATSRIVYHALASAFSDLHVIVEEKIPRSSLLRRRMKKLGVIRATGQVLFMLLALPLLRRAGSRRISMIKQTFGLVDSPIAAPTLRVSSVNSDEVLEALGRLDPCVVVVHGTRIIRRRILASITAPVINMHVGITPLYRGVHGGYWALVEGRPDLVGTTIHMVAPGIDTGNVIRQATFAVCPDDSFATYPFLHLGVGIPILLASIRDALNGTLVATPNPRGLPSVLRSHPTLWGYLWRRITRGVR